ncbi:putative mannosyltransferase [Saccharomycopsis crataegensis]|uniref:Mannosyltransferase n=1 Tax=Saccharomycopsis crataegensis TaxID=43959 RepID=A0AAV5QE00_9ASCO|nr:putative mannosyltransferase [Saccharomycopsis crataegensis]
MDLPYLQPRTAKSKSNSLLSKSKFRIKRFFSKKVKVFKVVYLPVWIICLVAGLLFYSQLHHIYPNNRAIHTKGQKMPDYSRKKYSEKFDKKYSPVDKSKVSNRWIGSTVDEPFKIGCVEPEISLTKKTANASLVVLARNKELDGVIKSMNTLERHFNQWFNYPWVFLNDEEFSDEFKKTVKKYTRSKVEFGLIGDNIWDFPLSKEETEENDKSDKSSRYFNFFEFYEFIERQGDRGIMYGNLDSYHKMCRFYSGGFYRHPLVKQYEWYWRVEPDVNFYCDLTYDPFLEMEKKGKKYGFTVIIKELSDTIPNLFRYTKSFIKENHIKVKSTWNLFVTPLNTFDFKGFDDPELEAELAHLEEVDDLILALEKQVQIEHIVRKLKNNKDGQKSSNNDDQMLLKQLVDKTHKRSISSSPGDAFDGEKYNYCHFWSNFEIARVDVWDNPLYNAYFDYLEQSGGFYKERWGDAPVHSLGAGMFLDLSEVHYFRDIGYKHSTIAHCPHNSFDNQLGYGPSENYFKFGDVNRIRRQDAKWLSPDSPKKNGVGCRCKCPRKQNKIEDTGGSCIGEWISVTKDAEAKKFDNSQRKYAKKLNVKKLKNLIAFDYQYSLKLKTIKEKYISSALIAFKDLKRFEEDENTVLRPDEFDLKLLEMTEDMINQKRLEVQEEEIMNNIVH